MRMKKELLQYACTPREERAITLRRKGFTFEKIGKELNISYSAVIRIIKHALSRMKEVTKKELLQARNQRPIMRVRELDTTRTRLIRYVLWTARLRTLEQVAEAGYSKLRTLGMSEKSIQVVVEILQTYNLTLKGWKEKEENEAIIGEIAKEFENWWKTAKVKIPSSELPKLQRKIRKILYS
mgnify:CR=1 FL=1